MWCVDDGGSMLAQFHVLKGAQKMSYDLHNMKWNSLNHLWQHYGYQPFRNRLSRWEEIATWTWPKIERPITNQSINQNSWRPDVVGVPRLMHPLWWSPIDACHLQRVAMMTSTGSSIPWCCPSTIYAVYLRDAFRPRSPVVWSSAAYHSDIHGRTMIVLRLCDLRRTGSS